MPLPTPRPTPGPRRTSPPGLGVPAAPGGLATAAVVLGGLLLAACPPGPPVRAADPPAAVSPAATRPAAASAPAAAAGRDWPQFLGPTRDGVYAGSDLVDAIPPGVKPKVLWQREVGAGWSAPVVAGGRVLIHHRVRDDAVLDCLDADTGKPVWSAKHRTDYTDGFDFDPGPRATPAVANGRAFTFGAEGTLAAWDLATGKPLWSVDAAKTYGARRGFFGLAPSPVVAGDLVIATLGGAAGGGGPARTVVALDARTGALAWSHATPDQAEAGYASPTVATLGGERCLLAVDREGFGVLSLDRRGAAVAPRLPFRSRQSASVNAATPLAVGDEVFLSASYGVGAKLLKFEPAGGGGTGGGGAGKLRVVWANDESMSNHYATCVVRDGMLYGFHGRQEQGPELRCVEWATGKVRWTQPDLGTGTVTLAGDKLLVLTEKGALVMAAASPDGFKELGRAQVLGFDTRAYPAVAGGKLYARGKDKLVCVDLRRAAESTPK